MIFNDEDTVLLDGDQLVINELVEHGRICLFFLRRAGAEVWDVFHYKTIHYSSPTEESWLELLAEASGLKLERNRGVEEIGVCKALEGHREFSGTTHLSSWKFAR